MFPLLELPEMEPVIIKELGRGGFGVVYILLCLGDEAGLVELLLILTILPAACDSS